MEGSLPAARTPRSTTGEGLFDWLRAMTGDQLRAFISTFLGWGLDGMDVQIYSFVIPALITLWGISKGQAGLLATVTLLASALGGWVAGMLADRLGRVRLLMITVGWYALFTFLSGFTNSFEQLLVTRTLQGFGFGGEWAAGAVLMGEFATPRNRGKTLGSVQSGWAVGWGVAALAATIIFAILPKSEGWRIMFWIGILPAFLTIFIRRFVKEPEVYSESRDLTTRSEGAAVSQNPLEIFQGNLRGTVVLTALLTTGMQGGYYAITTFLPTYLQTVRHLSVLKTGGYLFVIILGSFIGYIVAGYLADLAGRKRTFLWYAIGSAVVVILYAYAPINNTAMLFLGFPLGFFASGIFSGVGPYLTELFPTRVRGSGQGFTYNFGRGMGALFPPLVGFLSGSLGLGTAIAIYATAAYVLVIIVLFFLPETRGKELVAYD